MAELQSFLQGGNSNREVISNEKYFQLEDCIQLWGPKHKKDMDLLD